MPLPTIIEALTALGFTDDLMRPDEVLLARHVERAFPILTRSLAAFEEYQRFQNGNYFAKCKFIVAFVGKPGEYPTATFVGVYRVLGTAKEGESGFRPPEGDPVVIAETLGQKYLNNLERMTELDDRMGAIDIAWNLPGTAKYIYMKPDVNVSVLRCDIPQISVPQDSASLSTLAIESEGYAEGTLRYVLHAKRERSSVLIAKVKAAAKAAGKYRCAACNFDPDVVYGKGIDCLECHHTIPVSEMRPGDATKEEDVILLCANCHRAIHRHQPLLRKHEISMLLIQ